MQQAEITSVMTKKPKVGRPALADDEKQAQVAVRFPQALIERIDAISEARADQPNRSAIVREATALGLEILEARMRKGAK